MLHFSPRALPGTVLFRDHHEAAALWRILLRHTRPIVALYLMPDHVHLLVHRDVTDALRLAMGAYARWRNARRGQWGRVWRRLDGATEVLDGQKARRSVRYVHLNGCRKRLHTDPLAWPWSTHRDALGLTAWPVRASERDPHGFHRYVSADPTVCVDGTDLPADFGGVLEGEDGLERLVDAVSAVTRTPIDALVTRGPARTGLIRAARTLGRWPATRLADLARVTRRTVWRTEPFEDDVVRAAQRVVCDPRFRALPVGDLRPTWWCYRDCR